MDCCGSSKPEEKNENIKEDQTANGKNPIGKEQAHGGGCCGDSSTGMWLHLILMIIVVLIISYITKR